MTGKRDVNVLKIVAIIISAMVCAFIGNNWTRENLMPQSFDVEEIDYVSNPCLQIWQQGIEGLDYETLDIKILDYNIDIREVYTTPLELLDNSKVQLTIDYWGYNITQEENVLLISDQNSFKKKLRIEFQGAQISSISQTYDTAIYKIGVTYATLAGMAIGICIMNIFETILSMIIKDKQENEEDS